MKHIEVPAVKKGYHAVNPAQEAVTADGLALGFGSCLGEGQLLGHCELGVRKVDVGH